MDLPIGKFCAWDFDSIFCLVEEEISEFNQRKREAGRSHPPQDVTHDGGYPPKLMYLM